MLSLHTSLSSKSFVLQTSPSFFRSPRAPSRALRIFLTASASSGSTNSDESHETLAGRRANYGGVRLEETVCIKSGKLRLDSWISSRINGISRARVQSSIRSGLVAVNGHVVDKVSHNVKAGDKVDCTISELQPLRAEPENIPLNIVYEDEHVLVVNKPAHMVVHPAPGNATGTLVNGILHHCSLPVVAFSNEDVPSDAEDISDDEFSSFFKDQSPNELLYSSQSRAAIRPGIVHRLDKGTSGLLVVAKDEHSHAHLSEQFKLHTIQRVYISLTSGVPSPTAGRVEVPIGRDINNRIRMVAVSGSNNCRQARHAASRYKVIEILAGGGSALVEWRLETEALLMRAAKLAPDDAVLGETSGGGGGSSAVVAPSSALEDEVVEVPGGVGGNDVIVGSGAGDLGKKKKVVKRVRKKIKKMEVGEQTVIVAKDEEKEETVKASDIVESVEPTAVEITDNIVFRKLASDDAVLGETSGGGGGSSGVVVLSSSLALEDEVVEAPGGVSGNDVIVGSGAGDLGKKKKVLKRVRKKKIKKMEVGEQTVIVAKDEEKEETVKASDIVESLEPTAVEVTDNIVFRKLLRGPRYFDPPDSSWGKCFNCGEEGHTVANCTAVKRKKPCFVCGSLEHSAKQCSKGQDCFICKKGGHRAKDCPEKHNGGYPSLKICLKCGDSGHDMFSCWNGYYSPDDLKGIQCYICNRFGHLCCGNSVNSNTSPRVISCYKCGQLGHTGLACAKIHGEDTGTWSSSSCYKCGEEGHFARECMSSAKANKRSREFSTPTLRFHREEKDYSEFKSVPLDLGKVRKRKKTRNDEKGIATPQKSKRRGGWIVEDPGDFSHRKSEKGSWRSPATPSSKGRKIAGLTAGGHISGSQSSKKSSTVLSGSSTSQGWSKGFQHRFSAARFGNSGSEGMQRNYNWW